MTGRQLAGLRFARGAWLCALATAGWSCGDHSFGRHDLAARRGSAEGAIVSSVDGVSIGARELEQLAVAGKLGKREALARLQAERLLEAEAQQRGYGGDPASRQLVRQALVQELLRGDVEAGDIPESEIAQAYEQQVARFRMPEKRVSSHLLVELPKNPSAVQEAAARAFAQDACQKLKAASDRLATLQALAAAATHSTLNVRVENLPAVADNGAFVGEFLRALFALPAPGVVPEPVRTQFGWHAIVLTAIQPATSVPLSEASTGLQKELSAKRSQQRVAEMLERLQRERVVNYSEATQQTLSQLEF